MAEQHGVQLASLTQATQDELVLLAREVDIGVAYATLDDANCRMKLGRVQSGPVRSGGDKLKEGPPRRGGWSACRDDARQ